MFAARGNARALDRARRCGRHVTVLAVCAVGIVVGAATPAQADNIGATRAEANRVWNQIQANGQRLNGVIERYDGARYRLNQTMGQIHENEIRLATAKINLTKARHALSVSLISAYKNPEPDPLEAALEARNFGQVLEQFSLLDKANSYNASILTNIRGYQKDVNTRQHALDLERNQRRATVAELQSLQQRIRSSVAAEKSRYNGLKAKVKRLIVERQQAEVRASQAAAARARQLQAVSNVQPVAVNDIGGVTASAPSGSSSDPGVNAAVPPPSTLGQAAANIALQELGTPYVWGGAAPGGFDCSGLVVWSYAQAGLSGLPHYTGALWALGTHVPESELAPGDLVFFDGLNHVGMYIGNGSFVEAPHTGDVVKVSSLAARSDYVGAVRLSG